MAHDIIYTPYPLGRKVEHDPRSREYPIRAVSLSELESRKWNRYAIVFNQGNLGSCTGNAGLGGLATGPLFYTLQKANMLPPFTQSEAVRIYSEATKIDPFPGEYPPDDTGSSNLAVAKILRREGKIDSYYHAFSFNAALTGLFQGPVMTGVNWYESMFFPLSSGECHISVTSRNAGGHAVIMDELDMENERVWFTNSWGPYWGLNGRAWFSFATWERLLREYGDVTQLRPIVVSTENEEIEENTPENPEVEEDTPGVTPGGCLVAIFGPWATEILIQKWQTRKIKN